jgi:Ca-activated chloride channel family protein
MKTTARLAHEALRFDQPVQSHLVVSLAAPPVEAGRPRPPVCVVPVIDVSGSMEGEKLFRAKQSVMKLVDHLGPGDRCGAVAFTTEAHVLAPALPMTPEAKAALKLALGDLRALANTNLSGGMLEGLGLANAPGLPDGMLVRVILFTDGLANAGLATTSEQLLPLLDARRGRATLSAFGYGHDADQELLTDLARRGGGNYAFIESPDQALSAFGRELGGLLSTAAAGLRVRVVPAPGARVVSVVSDVDALEEHGATVLRADDLLAEEERHLVLEVALEARPDPATVPAFQVEVACSVVDAGVLRPAAFAHAVQVDRVEPPFARPADPALDKIVVQAELLRAQLDAEGLARQGDHEGAWLRLAQGAALFESRGHAAEAQAARELGATMRDEATFRGSAGYRKSMQAGLRRGASTELDGEAEASLRRLGKQHRTSAQDDMAGSFGAGAPPPPGPTPPPAPRAPRSPPRSDPSRSPTRRRSGRW